MQQFTLIITSGMLILKTNKSEIESRTQQMKARAYQCIKTLACHCINTFLQVLCPSGQSSLPPMKPCSCLLPPSSLYVLPWPASGVLGGSGEASTHALWWTRPRLPWLRLRCTGDRLGLPGSFGENSGIDEGGIEMSICAVVCLQQLNMKVNGRVALCTPYMFFVHIIQFTDGLHEGEEVHSAAAINTWSVLELTEKEEDKVKEWDLTHE